MHRSGDLILMGLACLFASGCYRSTLSSNDDSDCDSPESNDIAPAPDSASVTDVSERCDEASYDLPSGIGFGCVIEEVDHNGDTVVDQRFLSVYGKLGELLYSERDENGDGTLEHRSVNRYDGNGLKMQEGSDMYADGSFESITRYQYNEAGKVREEARDADLDCIADQRSVYDYGDTLVQLKTVTVYKKDGSVLRVDTYFYDDLGRLVRRERDPYGDGSISARTHYIYDTSGHLYTEVQDSGSDASVFEKRFYFYDDAGRLIRKDWTDRDEMITAQRYYYYGGDDLLLLEDRHDGNELSERVSYIYDADDRLIHEETAGFPGATIESVRRFTYVCP